MRFFLALPSSSLLVVITGHFRVSALFLNLVIIVICRFNLFLATRLLLAMI